MPGRARRFVLLTSLWIFLSSVCYANVHGHSDCHGLRCPSLPAGIISPVLSILKEEPETLGLQWDSDHASGSDEVRSTVCALRLPVLECITWENCGACPAPARAARRCPSPCAGALRRMRPPRVRCVRPRSRRNAPGGALPRTLAHKGLGNAYPLQGAPRESGPSSWIIVASEGGRVHCRQSSTSRPGTC